MNKISMQDNFFIELAGRNEDSTYKEFTDSNRPNCISVSLWTLCKSRTKAKILGSLEIGESYKERGRTITRIK